MRFDENNSGGITRVKVLAYIRSTEFAKAKMTSAIHVVVNE